MDYKKHYNLLITRAKTRICEGYTEKHHIIPKCIGGTNNEENLVNLTPEEHYLAHQLLVKIYPNEYKLIAAASMMSVGKNRNNKLYGWLRRKLSDSMKGNKRGLNNKSTTGLTWKLSEETRRKQSESGKKKIVSQECKNNISKAKKNIKNPKLSEKRKGSIWITNGIDNKFITKIQTIPNGWYRGRTSSNKMKDASRKTCEYMRLKKNQIF